MEHQNCKNCRNNFLLNSPQRDLNNYKDFGFVNEKAMQKHNSSNKRCPYKTNIIIRENNNNVIEQNEELLPLWQSYKSNTELITEDDYCIEQEINQLKLKKHNSKGRQLWFNTTEEAALTIITLILIQTIQWITLVAEPGSGKTMVIHLLIYMISTLPYDKSISLSSITITTGMSDNEWYEQIKKNFELRDKKYLWEDLNKINENHCIVHRTNFHKRITYLLNNQQYLSNHIFIIDESHFADEGDMTIDNEFKRLGLTEKRMKDYNIKILFISATPDVNLSLMSNQDNHKLVQLKNGNGYKGFLYHYNNNRIINDSEINNLALFIRSKWRNPRYHIIRARTQQEKGEFRSNIINTCEENNWKLIEDDSNNNIYLSYYNDESERIALSNEKKIIKLYERPEDHTFILIKNKYSASKRLKLNQFTGLIFEKTSKKRNATNTCNGLVPRYFGYDDFPQYEDNEEPLFACDIESVKEYIKFSKDFIYNKKDYTGSKIKSEPTKTKELKNTCYGNLALIHPKIKDSDIDISGPYDKTYDIATFLLEERRFRKNGIVVNKIIFDDSNKGNDGYMYPKRNVPGHTRNDIDSKFLTKDVYEYKFVNNGGGSFINRQGNNATGQCFMVYPVYDNIDSNPDDYKFYVHSLKFNEI